MWLPLPTRTQLAHAALFVLSAAGVAALLQAGLHHPELLVLLAAVGVAHQAKRHLARRKLRELLDTGDIARLLEAWEALPATSARGRAAERLMRATALASYGWTARARQLLEIGASAPLNETLDHRVFLEVLLASLEGDHDRAIKLARALEALPLPERRAIRSRAATLRAGASAMARAYGHCGTLGDEARLRKASRQNPLLVWPMRYAEAQLSLQLGDPKNARKLLKKAPAWPEQSAFRSLTRVLREHMTRCGR